MKTKLILIASILIAGFMFTSFQKGKTNDIIVTNSPEQISEMNVLPTSFVVPAPYNRYVPQLIKNYPDPFTTTTNIEFYVPKSGWVTIEVLNLTERYVVRILSEFRDQGQYRAFFDGTEHPPGRYLIQMRIGGMLVTKMTLKVAEKGNGTVNGKH